ncbi:MAG: exodeoxyribonuclease III [Planctomycetes bacterium]|nr:exodeoxyribonuclease III [Planctomycetota bacterium]
MRCVSWNVNGLRAVARRSGFAAWLARQRADLVMLQETKARLAELPAEVTGVDGFGVRVVHAQKKGYSGVAIYYRDEPDEWFEGLGEPEFDAEGRALFARYGKVVYGSAYFPNSQEGGRRLDYRLRFNARVHAFLDEQRARGRHVVLGGDYNVSHREIDLARPRENVGNPGFLPAERDWFDAFLASGYTDTFRRRHPELADAYTWWSYRAGARARNVGWRLDYFCVDDDLWPRVRGVGILADVHGSDHCPVTVEIAARG